MPLFHIGARLKLRNSPVFFSRISFAARDTNYLVLYFQVRHLKSLSSIFHLVPERKITSNPSRYVSPIPTTRFGTTSARRAFKSQKGVMKFKSSDHLYFAVKLIR